MPPPRRDLSERFWSFVDQSAGADACWPWRGGCSGNGYGAFSIDGARWRPYSRGPSSQVSLAAEFGVTQMAISKVVRGDNWRSV